MAQDRCTLQDDVIFEVLSRLPVKSLIRFKAACKAWHALISKPSFIASHYERSKANPSLLILPVERDLYQRTVDLYSYKKEARVSELLLHRPLPPEDKFLWLYPCQKGMVLLFSERSIHICNPSTKEFLTLPKASPSPPYAYYINQRVGFGLDSSVNKYKVVWIFPRNFDDDTQDYDLGCEVFTLGDGSWREIDTPPCYILNKCPATVGDVIFWAACGEEYGRVILQFSLRDERFGMVRAPPFEAKDSHSHIPSLVELGGDLSYVVRRSDSHMMDIWVMNACNNAWGKKYSIDTSNYWFVKPVAMHDGNILLSSGDRLDYFDPRSKTSTPVVAIGGLPNEEYPWQRACMSFLDESCYFFVALCAENLVSVITV